MKACNNFKDEGLSYNSKRVVEGRTSNEDVMRREEL